MKLTEYIEEAISSGKHGGLSRVINLDDFHKKLIDTLALAYEFDEFPGDDQRSVYTTNPTLFLRTLYHSIGEIESYLKREYKDGRTRYYVNVPRYGKAGSLIWHMEFNGKRLISAELYSYYKGNVNKETDDIDAAEDLVEYLNCRTFEEKKKWLIANA